MIDPKIIFIPEKKLVGMRLKMSFEEISTSTTKLWQNFMPNRNKIVHKINLDLLSVQIYDSSLNYVDFTPNTVFEKWAAVEVENFNKIPKGMKTMIIPKGNYAVFIHQGLPNTFHKTTQYIFDTWLPNSIYQLDNRPHFEIMRADYNPKDPNAKELVWIPVI
ncbi:MAG: GyrI-like domain-containing protein [Flavobacteriaceae bacterium]|nr:GyrI-like domain-containing protein [Flavobacteriaceae bacterium]